ncbi:acyltransferase family protein [Mucilaginibacter lappiensis]|jgi:predicted acyltransferase|uniref:acyltransferase family protein n=1 Tax=Mucilaginibacter lappiensis TaxID=354630 RepID=UPI003D251A42
MTTATSTSAGNTAPDDINTAPTRLFSLDALRGFDMFWIMGGEEIFHTLAKATGSPFWGSIANQFTHPDWNGFHLYDLIFPLFLFMAGVSTPFSVGRELEKGKSKQQLTIRVIKRAAILVLLGLVVNNGLNIMPISEIRFASVLGRIGIAYMFANIIYLYSSERMQMVWFWFFIIGYWLLLKFTSAPGFAPGDLTMQGNFASYMDRILLPGKLYLGIHDPEGLFSTIPAISTGLLGILTGSLLKKTGLKQIRKVSIMAVTGVIFLIIAQIWNLDFPINKNLWSSSFVMQVGGISLLLMALFYYIIDVLGYKKWAFFFKVIGMNSILIYISGHFIKWQYTTNGFFGWIGQLVGDPYNIVVMAVCFIMVKWLFLYYLYQKKTFLRV